MSQLSQEELISLFDYDKDTGTFKYKKAVGKMKVGDIAGANCDGYRQIEINRKKYAAHRLAWFYVYGYFPEKGIDHINHNPSDNRIKNLREADVLTNNKNATLSKKNTSGFTGVYFDKERKLYVASIRVYPKRIKIGRFKNIEDAIEARKQANIKYGFHENHGKARI